MKTIITGGLGFIGSNLVATLENSDEIEIIDDLSTGDIRFADRMKSKTSFHRIDLSKDCIDGLTEIFSGAGRIFHLAANADVRGGWQNSQRDINQNILATYNVAEAARRASVPEIVFASTGCVYGDSSLVPTPEGEPFPVQTSLYGMSKTAAEGILSSYAAQGAFSVTVFRFVSVLGSNYHHGHVIDFVRKLRINPNQLHVLGNGSQKKSYIHVKDCVSALLNLRSGNPFDVFNIGHDYFISVKESARMVAEFMGYEPEFVFGSAERGWIGDNPFTFLSTSKAKSFGWSPTFTIEKSIQDTVDFLIENEWVLNKRDYRDGI